MAEKSIIINGVTLTKGQSMVVRVALDSFMGYLVREGLGDDDMAELLSVAYQKAIYDIGKM